jgi:putative transposase
VKEQRDAPIKSRHNLQKTERTTDRLPRIHAAGYLKADSTEVVVEFRRNYQSGGCYFFTVVTQNRQPILTCPDNINRLRNTLLHIKNKRPFIIEAIVILPDHLHTVWQLPEGDADFSTRWRMIKHDFSITVQGGIKSRSQQRKGEKGIWQRRFWEHTIRNKADWHRHIDYIHYNPVKHGYVDSPSSWPYSSFSSAVNKGWYSQDWGQQEPESIKSMCLE